MPFAEISGCLHDDPLICDEDKLRIDVLSESESKLCWDSYVSSKNRHFKLLDKREWPSQLVASTPQFYCWQDDWNANAASNFTTRMKALDLMPDDTVHVFWMRETCARTDWATFTKNWINFLYEDEGCIVLSESRMTAVVLSNGYSWVGKRTQN